MPTSLHTVLNQFTEKNTVDDVVPLRTGHINDSYIVKTKAPGTGEYLLQRINHRVFTDIPALMENIDIVTNHIRQKLMRIASADIGRHVMTIIRTRTGDLFYKDNAGNYWRMFLYIPGCRSYDMVDSCEKAYTGGKAYGNFQAMLADLPANALHEIIPRFHDVLFRLDNFRDAVKANVAGRVHEVADEKSFVLRRAESMMVIRTLGEQGVLPLRITHNDTKFNNILLDGNDRAVCVVDLDTVMPGYVHYDFGDAVRTAASTGTEDEPDISKVSLDISLFEAFSRGFLEETRSMLIPAEVDTLAHAPLLLTYIMGLRFLTDYLNGDTYYKIRFKGHNLQRARAQFQLLAGMERRFAAIDSIIKKIAHAKGSVWLK